MLLRRVIFSLAPALCVLMAGVSCANGEPIPLSEVMKDPGKFDNKILDLTGFILVDGYVPKFYPLSDDAKRQDISDVVDLMPDNKDVDKKLKSYTTVSCVVLTGKFRQYKGKFIGIGNFVSKFGAIEVSNTMPCESPK